MQHLPSRVLLLLLELLLLLLSLLEPLLILLLEFVVAALPGARWVTLDSGANSSISKAALVNGFVGMKTELAYTSSLTKWIPLSTAHCIISASTSLEYTKP